MASWYETQTPEQLRHYLLSHPTGASSSQEKDVIGSASEPFNIWSHYVKLVEQRYQSDPLIICEAYEWLLLGVPVMTTSSIGSATGNVPDSHSTQTADHASPIVHSVYHALRLKGTGYPLLYGYWIKWAQQVQKIATDDKVIEIYNLAVSYNRASLELWICYIMFLMENSSTNDAKSVRDTLERAVSCVGHLYHSGILWEKYIEFEQLQNEMIRVTNIYRRVFENALNVDQLQDIWKKFEAHIKDVSATELTTNVEERATLQELKSDEERKDVIISWTKDNFDRSKEISEKIKYFEDRIKRNYFHPKSLDEDDLDNWRRYLEFRELLQDYEATKQLYTQAIVAAAHSIDIFKRFISYLIRNQEISFARTILESAILSYCPGSRPQIWILLAEFEEEHGDFSSSCQIYESVLSSIRVSPKSTSKSHTKDEKIPPYNYSIAEGHLETGIQYLQAIFRKDTSEKLAFAYDRYKSTFSTAGGHFGAIYARLLLHIQGSEEASKIFTLNSQLFPNCKFAWIGLLEFEIDRRIRYVEARPAIEQVEYICSLFEQCILNEQMAHADREYLYYRYISFARLHCTISKVRAIEQMWFPFQCDFNVTKKQILHMKRARSNESDDRPQKRRRENEA